MCSPLHELRNRLKNLKEYELRKKLINLNENRLRNRLKNLNENGLRNRLKNLKEYELRKKLKEMGIKVENKRNHYNLIYGGKQYQIRRHPSQDFPNEYFSKIKKHFEFK